MKSSIWLIGLLVLGGCSGDKSTEVNLNFKNESDLSIEQAKQTISTFLEKCQAVALYADDLSEIKVLNGNPINRIDRLQGWTKKYELSFKIADKPVHPELIEAMAMGHTCYYDMGGGNRPGFQPAKTPCSNICKVPAATFIDAPLMVDLDNPKSEAYKKRYAEMDAQYQSNVLLYRNKAYQGDYQAQRNLAYVYGTDSFEPDDQIKACAWRAIIIQSQKKADETDKGNFKIDCGALNYDQKTAAAAVADEIFRNISSR